MLLSSLYLMQYVACEVLRFSRRFGAINAGIIGAKGETMYTPCL